MNGIASTVASLKSGKVKCEELVQSVIRSFEEDRKNPLPLNAFLELYDDILSKAREVDREIEKRVSEGTIESLYREKPLFGVPFAVKDNISVRGKKLTCASRILANYTSPYNATVIERLLSAGAIPLGRCNQDEFAMGSSTEYSCYGPTRNPIDRKYVSGGSSGGSAAAVASSLAAFALGTETGGSVRLPASYCSLYGYKPTYGVLSRYGVVAYGSSLDQVGIFAHTPEDVAAALFVMSGKDVHDETSANLPQSENLQSLTAPASARGLRIALPRQFISREGLDEEVRETFEEVKRFFSNQGALLSEVDLPILDASIACYYTIAFAEAASNLSRFDGIRYGERVDTLGGYDNLFIQTRSRGFGPEVKRRIVIGNYLLSEQFSGDTYKKGMTVRATLQEEIKKLFSSFDLMLCPTCPTSAFKIGEKVDNPLEMYLSDLYTTFVNLARIPSVSVPAGRTRKNLGVGVQFIGPLFSDVRILSLASLWEKHFPNCGFISEGGKK